MEFGKKDDSWMLSIYREMGYYICRREEYDRALTFFDEALTKVAVDKRTFLGRSRARSKVCDYEGAIRDIEKALEIDPDDLTVTAQRALNMYLSCEFEDALVLNYQMVPNRTKPDNFTMGVMHCNEAIENCVGLRTGHPLRDHYKIIRRIAWKKIKEVENPFAVERKRKTKKSEEGRKIIKEPVIPDIRALQAQSKSMGDELCILDSLHSFKAESDVIPPCKFPYRPKQRNTSNIENYMAEKYLDSMYLDKIFLKGLKYHPGTISPNEKGTKSIINLSKEGYKLLSYKQELLRTRRPFYFLKHQEARITGAFRKRVLAQWKKLQVAAKVQADNLLRLVKQAVHQKRTRYALEMAEKLKTYCQCINKQLLPNRDEYLQIMYKFVALAYYQMYRINDNQHESNQSKRILDWMGLPYSREPSLDSIIVQFKDVFVDWKKQIFIFEDRLRKAKSPDEMCWLYHELARYHTEIKQYELARVYCRKCVQEGTLAESMHWIINGMMMLGKLSMQQHNKNDAKTDFTNALKVARKMGDAVLERYIIKCLRVVDVVEFDDHFGAKVVEKREKQIINLLTGEGIKDEVAFLFRKMDVMPADRRMSVMPGIRVEDTKKPTLSMQKSSIMPTSKPSVEGKPPKHVLEAASKATAAEGGGESKKGVAFIELIKFHID
ncbi:hypothetical protein FQR65_LT08602 [Abscondita terminalis]|nr:hypothetical protein FQR65_LT08602 [Abscondita terminalis]